MIKLENAYEENVGTRIYLLRMDRGYSREYLSEKAGISSKF